jgi:hypothetical protein
VFIMLFKMRVITKNFDFYFFLTGRSELDTEQIPFLWKTMRDLQPAQAARPCLKMVAFP